MENASKALLMAAAVLIAILVLTLIVYLSANFSAIKADNTEKMNQQSLEAFNGKYLAYDGRTDLTYYDIANITTMAKNDNENNGSNISVYIGRISRKNWVNNSNYKEMMGIFATSGGIDSIMKKESVKDIATGGSKEVKVLEKYTCEVKLGEESGRVETVRFINN